MMGILLKHAPAIMAIPKPLTVSLLKQLPFVKGNAIRQILGETCLLGSPLQIQSAIADETEVKTSNETSSIAYIYG
jgi:hypothetical protein